MGSFDIDYPRALLAALAVTVFIALLVAGSTSTAAFGTYNPSWDGTAALRERATTAGIDSEVVTDTSEIAAGPAEGTVAVVFSPDRRYSAADVAHLSEFLEHGGTVLVADDYGRYANSLLSRLGANTRINGTPLRDERNNYRSAAFPVTTAVSNHSLVANVSGLTLNHGTVLRPNGATVLVNSSSFSYLDTDRNGQLGGTETIGRHPVATVERVNGGRVVVVSDPSVFINAMIDRPGNAEFVENLFAGSERVRIDASHTADVPPLVRTLMILRESSSAQLLVGVAGLALVALSSRGSEIVARIRHLLDRSPDRSHRPSPADLDAAVRARHPEWDPERVRRITRLRREGTNRTRRRRE